MDGGEGIQWGPGGRKGWGWEAVIGVGGGIWGGRHTHSWAGVLYPDALIRGWTTVPTDGGKKGDGSRIFALNRKLSEESNV